MSESKTPRRPGGRRPIPPLIFLVVLAILAVAVWWQVIRKNEDQTARESAPCTLTASDEQIADLNNMANVQVIVLNATEQAGLAASIQAELTGRGFTVLEIGNASGAPVPEAGMIQYGSGNKFKAELLAAHFPDFTVDRSNHITDGSVHLTAGQAYAGLADANQAAQTVEGVVAAEAKIVAGCPAPED